MALTTGTLTLDANFHTISVIASFTTTDAAAGNGVTLRYRRTTGPGAWRTYSSDLIYIDTRPTFPGYYGVNWAVNQARCKIFGLTPNVSYDVEVTFTGTVTGTNPLSGAAATISDTPPDPSLRDLYVDGAAANDNGTGLIGSPKKYIASAFALAQAGDTIFIKGAQTYTLTSPAQLSADGTASNWIRVTVEPATGEAIIQGDGLISYVIGIRGSYTRVDHLTIRKAVQTVLGVSRYNAQQQYIWVDNCIVTDWNILDNTARNDYAGISLATSSPAEYGIMRTFIIDNYLKRREVVVGSQSGAGYGIYSKQETAPTGGHHIIRGNTVIGGVDGISAEGEGMSRGGWYRNTDICDNIISEVRDNAFQLDGAAVNCAAWNNSTSTSLSGPSLNPIIVGPVYSIRNKSRDIKFMGGYAGPMAYKVGSNSDGRIYIIHDSMYASTYANGIFQTDSGFNNIFVKNTALWADGDVVQANSFTGSGITVMDYNCLYGTGRIDGRFGQWAGNTYYTWGAFKTGTGFETNGLNREMVSLDWTDAANGDFSLKAGSALIGAAVSIPGINTDVEETSWNGLDIGATTSGVLPPNWTLTISATANGAIWVNGVLKTAGDYAYYQQTLSILAVPEAGYSLSAFTGDLAGATNPQSLSLTADKTVGATFVTADTWNLETEVVGSGSVSPASGQYADAANDDLTATAAANNEFVEWEGSTSGTTNPVNVVFGADKMVRAVFKPTTYLITVATRGSGTVKPASGKRSYIKGEVLSFTAYPTGSASFLEWRKDNVQVSTSAVYSYTVAASCVITAVFS